MSRATKRKHVIREVLVEEIRPPTEEQSIVQVLAGRGNNLHLVAPASGEPFLASMPTKFRRNVWIKRGDYLLVEPIPEGDKVKAEIVTIVTRDHEKFYRELGIWPPEFDKNGSGAENLKNGREVGDTSEDEDLFVNKNRQVVEVSESDETESDDDESGSDLDDDGARESASDNCEPVSVESEADDRTGDSDSDGGEPDVIKDTCSSDKKQITTDSTLEKQENCKE
ncbi:probable RNA-binding protein EIF1AD [Schistocerca piceifrons]|uniref:probable RNA-binding protein EIF1AD n=1 Tax=Schistocerca piceifrons TaxID=274613 RepID=UPI001F5EF803|nr:probable RNA-binding protein EIF1AD [Schistocerca piceifrons]